MPRFLFLLALCAWLSASGASALRPGSPTPFLAPTDLRCEYATAPLGIDCETPRLSYCLEGGGRGSRQKARRILVASSEERLAANEGDLWDSGRVESEETVLIPYEGRKLRSTERVYWKVLSWNADDTPSDWSERGTWTMGLLAPSDWKAVWITAQSTSESILLRKEFQVRPGLRRALAYVCGLGSYEMRLNGEKVSDKLVAPGWTEFSKTTLYATEDLSARIVEGRNVLGIVLGNGMYNVVRKNRFAKFTKSFGPLRAIAQLRLEYSDGSVETVPTDPSWKTQPGPAVYNSIYGGEDYDARSALPGWDAKGFDDGNWSNAVPCVQCPTDTLKGHRRDSEPLRVAEIRRPIAVNPLPDGRVVYDLGQNASYMIRLRVSGPAGSTVRLLPAEVLKPDGSVNRDTMGKAHRGYSWWQYTKATDGEESWSPSFYYVGCRYLQAYLMPPGAQEPAPTSPPRADLPEIEDLEGLVVHADTRILGDFACSNALLNRIRALVRWAQRSNMVSVLTDCPHREKLGWIEQFHLNGPAIRYEFGVSRIFAKATHDMAEAQLEDGRIANIAPNYADFKGNFLSAPEWGAAFILVPWQQYLFEGDARLLADHYDGMKRYLAALEARAKDGILDEGLGDWYDLGPAKPGAAQLTPAKVTSTAFLCHDNEILGRIAAILGKHSDADAYSRRAAELRRRYNEAFYDREKGSYGSGSQCANAMPLALGIVDPGEAPRVLASLVADVERQGWSATAGDIGFRYLLRALADAGRSDVVYRMIDQDTKPGYGYQLKKGATSLTESWDANLGSSHNHFMLGQITEWFYHDLAGIRPDPERPGFRRVILHPTPVGDLRWAEASYLSPRGKIAIRWERNQRGLDLDVVLPPNTSGRLEIPCSDGARISVDGAPLSECRTARSLGRVGDRSVLELGSGAYRVSARE